DGAAELRRRRLVRRPDLEAMGIAAPGPPVTGSNGYGPGTGGSAGLAVLTGSGCPAPDEVLPKEPVRQSAVFRPLPDLRTAPGLTGMTPCLRAGGEPP
ncbi:selenocysteine-specific translation elongation factor, partial [Streptomyces sp. NPDC044948]